jgi:general secretion pathway protein N
MRGKRSGANASAGRPPRLRRWATAGLLLGAAGAAVAQLPAAWLARSVAALSEGRVLLADARGTLWSGDALAVLGAGAGSRDAAVLPGRLHWSVRWRDGGFELALRQACCLHGTPRLRIEPGWGRVALTLAPGNGGRGGAGQPLGRWPAAWLGGLGTPWNTLQLTGELRLSSGGLRAERVLGRWQFGGSARVELADIASRLATLPRLGSYRLEIDAPPGTPPGTAELALATDEGPLELEARGQWTAAGLRLRGQAQAAPGSEAALDNLLNIIGRRQGDRSLITIG